MSFCTVLCCIITHCIFINDKQNHSIIHQNKSINQINIASKITNESEFHHRLTGHKKQTLHIVLTTGQFIS